MKELLKRKRNLLLLLIPLGIFFTQWAKGSAYIAETVFAAGIYKILSQIMGCLTGWLPFSLMELIVAAGPFLIAGLLVRQILRAVRVKEGGGISVGTKRFFLLMTAIQNLLCLVSVIFFSYVILCGVNYYRYPVAVSFGLTVEDSSQEELEGLLMALAQRASALREELTTEDEQGVYQLTYSVRELGKEAKKAYKALSDDYEVFAGVYPAPKPVFFSRLMSYTEITGVFTPWTMEANVNVDISPYSIGVTMCHELAHLRGFMREDEANYIAIRACWASDSIDLQYSGTLFGLTYAGNALYAKDAESYFEIYRQYYSEAVIRDLVANNEYWEQFKDTVVAETAGKVNDTYLKVNNQTDGTQSYGRVVDLLLAEYRQKQ